MSKITIPGTDISIGAGSPTFIIAEIGKGFIQTEEDRPYEEYLANAKELIKLAYEVGADAVKFQTHTVEDEQADLDVTSPHFKGSDRLKWVTRNTDATPDKFWRALKDYSDELGIIFFSTPMSRGAAMKINKVDPPIWKIGSGDILDFVAMDYMASTGKPIILSSGMSSIEEVDKAVDFLKKKNANFILLHCVSKYPCPPEELNLGTISFFKERYDVPIGFSDHSIGVEAPLAAVALGAVAIEKHFSTSRDHWGSDHKVSMVPNELRELVRRTRELEKNPDMAKEMLTSDSAKKSMGVRDKTLSEGEAVFRLFFRKTLVAARNIKSGESIGKEDIYSLRPQAHLDGMNSEKYKEVVGRTATQDIEKLTPLKEGMIK